MKKTHVIELLNNIKGTFKSFFSIMMFVALSIAIFVGISWVSTTIQNSASGMFKEGNMYDFEIQYPYGFTEEDLDELREVDGIDSLEAGYVSYQLSRLNKDEFVFKVMSLTEKINMVTVSDGRLPEKAGEIAIDSTWAETNGVKVGDKITFVHDREEQDNQDEKKSDGMEYLNGDTYEVTAIVMSPEYISKKDMSYGVSNLGSGFVQCVAYVDTKSFDLDAFLGYPQVYICNDTLSMESGFTDEYDAISAELQTVLKDLGDKKAEEKYKDVIDEAEKKVSEGELLLNDANAQISEAETQIAEGEQTLANSELSISAGERELSIGYEQLNRLQEEYDASDNKYITAKSLLSNLRTARDAYAKDSSEANLQELHKAYNQLSDFVYENWNVRIDEYADGDINNNIDDFKTFVDLLLDNEDMILENAGSTLAEKKEELEQGWRTYNEKSALLEEKRAELARGYMLLEQKTRQMADAKKEYEQAKDELKREKERIAGLEEYKWNIVSRNDNGGVLRVQRFSDMTDNLRFSMAALFVVIGLLVSYSAVARIVQDQRQLLGTKKALGMHRWEVAISYMAYSGGAVLLGGAIGLVLGTQVVQRILVNIIGGNYIMTDFTLHFDVTEALILVAFELVAILAATWMACRNVLKQQAVILLKGAEPPKAKTRFFERWGVWNSLPLFSKTVINNCLNDKRRVFATIVGIAGCTALIVTAITINDNLRKSFDSQYEDIYGYDSIVRFSTEDSSEQTTIGNRLTGAGAEGTMVHRSSYKIILPNNSTNAVSITVPMEEKEFSHFYSCNKVGEESKDYENGAWINSAYGEHMGAKVGDKVEIVDAHGQSYDITIEGFFEFYLLSYQLIMDSDDYKNVFGKECSANAYLVDSKGAGAKALEKQFDGLSYVNAVDDDYGTSFDIFNEFFQIARSVIILYLVLSVLMAIVVLYDLYAVFIEEKKRELIIMMINGYSEKSAKQYIYRDTLVLTVIGIILGMVLGSLMGNITILSIEPDEGCFVKAIDWIACGIGALVSAILAFVLCSVAMRKIRKFKLTDINRI